MLKRNFGKLYVIFTHPPKDRIVSISFSGLASGLDTSSWVESLVAVKQAKIDTLEEQKETVLLSRETLNNIKSFFNSFRSVIEKVTNLLLLLI